MLFVLLNYCRPLPLQTWIMDLPALLLSCILPLWRLRLQQLFPCLILSKWFFWSLQISIISIDECRWCHIFLVRVFSTLLMAPCRVLLLIWLLMLILLYRLILLFLIGNNMINLFWVHYFLLFQWIYCILLLIVKSRIVFGVILSKTSVPRLILAFYNFMDLFKIFVKVILKSLYICKRPNHYLMN